MDQNNKYTKMQRDQYNAGADEMAIENHRNHDLNPDYYGLLLKQISENPNKWQNKRALDFGCGIGRNVDNLLRLSSWDRVDGCDISSENIDRAGRYLSSENHKNYKLYTTTGIDLQPIESDQYDFVMSTIVLQHIAVHDIRFSLFQDIFRVMKMGGLFSFQMAAYFVGNYAKYYENIYDAKATNGAYDVSINNPQDLIDDLQKIGYKNITFTIKPEWDYGNKKYFDTSRSHWIYVETHK